VIILDASVLIAHFDGRDAHHMQAVSLLRAAAEADKPLAASAVTLAEVLVGPVRAGQMPAAERALAALGVTSVGLGADAAIRLAALRVNTGLKMPDCCVLLAAQDRAAQAVLSFDGKLQTAAQRAGYAITLEP
jgi:predicted nucleic acid-binding protein